MKLGKMELEIGRAVAWVQLGIWMVASILYAIKILTGEAELPHILASNTVLAVLIAAGFVAAGFSLYVVYHRKPEYPIPMAGTPASREWIYQPLNEIYRRTFHDEEILLDGHFFIDCVFGKNVKLRYDGTAPFKMTNSQPNAEYTWSLSTNNVSIQHLLKFLMDAKQIGGGFIHEPTPPKKG